MRGGHIARGEMRRVGHDRAADAVDVVVRQAAPRNIGQRAQDRPVFLAFARRERGAGGELNPALAVHIEPGLFGVGGAGEHDVGAMRAGVAVRALIDDERAREPRHVDLIDAEQEDELDVALRRAVEDRVRVAAVGARQEAEIERADARGGRVQHVESVPAAFGGRSGGTDHAGGRGDALREAQDRCAIGAGERALAQDQHRPLGVAQHLREGVRAGGDLFEHARPRRPTARRDR